MTSNSPTQPIVSQSPVLTRRLGRTEHHSSVAVLGGAAFWGTDPEVGPAVLGRDLFAYDEDADEFDEFDDAAAQPSREPARGRAS